MKKIICFILTPILLISIISVCFALPVDVINDKKPLPLADYDEVEHYCSQIKEMSLEENAVNSRLIVMANKNIDYQGAVQVAGCSDGSYVLQYENKEQAEKAFNYYESKNHVLSVCYDFIPNMEFTSADPLDFNSITYSTTNSNIDDAYKLLAENNIELPEIKVGIYDTGVALNDVTAPRFLGGYSYLSGYAENGTQVPEEGKGYHGTMSAGTVIRNTLDNVKIYSYQVSDGNGGGITYSGLSSAIKLGASQGCKVLNFSFTTSINVTDTLSKQSFESACKVLNTTIAQVANEGCHLVCSAGNDNKSLSELYYLPQRCDAVIVSGANDLSNVRASFSNYGSLVDIYTLGNGVSTCNVDGSLYEKYNGTSASSPVLASICTILLSVNPNITNDEIITLLQATGSPLNAEKQRTAYSIIADAYEAVKNLLNSQGLSKAQFSYKITKDENTNDAVLTISAPENTDVCYKENEASSIYFKPYIDKYVEPLHFANGGIVSVCAYAENKEKYYKLIRIPNYNDAEYSVTKAVNSRTLNTLDYYDTAEKVVIIPEYIDDIQIQEIGAYCFTGNEKIEKIVLPSSVTKIDEYAFASCPNLKVVIADGVTSCGRYCFSNSSVARLSLPKLCSGNSALFENCTDLKLLESGCMNFDYHRCYAYCSSLKLVNSIAGNNYTSLTISNKNAIMGTSFTVLTDCIKSSDALPSVNLINNLNKHTCEYMCEDNFDGTYSYYCVWCWQEQLMAKDDLLAMWNVKYVNTEPSYYSDGYLLDVNNDNIINAKDFAMINKL